MYVRCHPGCGACVGHANHLGAKVHRAHTSRRDALRLCDGLAHVLGRRGLRRGRPAAWRATTTTAAHAPSAVSSAGTRCRRRRRVRRRRGLQRGHRLDRDVGARSASSRATGSPRAFDEGIGGWDASTVMKAYAFGRSAASNATDADAQGACEKDVGAFEKDVLRSSVRRPRGEENRAGQLSPEAVPGASLRVVRALHDRGGPTAVSGGHVSAWRARHKMVFAPGHLFVGRGAIADGGRRVEPAPTTAAPRRHDRPQKCPRGDRTEL